jgi:3'-phosphoadenosine 5'-phosphosulfate sulfotransferase (PAPS reductase)/FAD synthetase
MNDLDAKITSAREALAETRAEIEAGGRQVAGVAVLFSGGRDSTVLAHLFREQASHAIHANTGIGIEETRQFVRDTCQLWGLPLIEEHPPVSYRALVLEQGFPGPAHHWKMYQRLKERCLDAARGHILTSRRKQRLIFLAGRRRSESARRADLTAKQYDGSVIWLSPLVDWTAADLNDYRRRYPDLPLNEVTQRLHMSGECLCGAFAHAGELDEIGFWFPEVHAEIKALEAEVQAAGNASQQRCAWGWGAYRDHSQSSRSGMLCSSCEAPDE